jgi:hypothetical protein
MALRFCPLRRATTSTRKICADLRNPPSLSYGVAGK